MNVKRSLIGACTLLVLLLSACGDDDKSDPKKQFTFRNEKISLEDANLFLANNGTFGGGEDGNYRRYIITDGQANGSGSTFHVEVQLANKVEDAVDVGTFPAFWDWGLTPETSSFGYVYAEIGEEVDEEFVSLDLLEDADGSDKITVSGGLDDGDTMTIKFTGTMEYYHFDAETEEWVTEDITGNLYFKGEVEDISSSPAKKGQSVRGGKKVSLQ